MEHMKAGPGDDYIRDLICQFQNSKLKRKKNYQWSTLSNHSRETELPSAKKRFNKKKKQYKIAKEKSKKSVNSLKNRRRNSSLPATESNFTS